MTVMSPLPEWDRLAACIGLKRFHRASAVKAKKDDLELINMAGDAFIPRIPDRPMVI